MKELRGRVALVTGASMGIGAACAQALARQGCRVALIARGRAALETMAATIRSDGGVAHAYACDLGDAQALAATFSVIEAEMGPIDILVNNAGAGTFKPLDQMTLDEALLTVALPFGAAVGACHRVLPGMLARGAGHIVNLTSPASYLPLPYMVPYTAARHAMRGLSLSLREEVAARGVGVSPVCPSKVATGYFERNDADFGWYPRLSAGFPTLQPTQVGDEVVRAIRGDLREHIFPFSLGVLIRLFQLAPRLNLWLLKKLGLFQPARRAISFVELAQRTVPGS